MKDATDSHEALSGAACGLLPDIEKYTEDLGQQLNNSPMPAVVAVQGSWDFGRSFLPLTKSLSFALALSLSTAKGKT